VVEADEVHQNAGEKGIEHLDPDDQPRRRANGRRGRGTFANDRPPVAGMVGRESGEIRLEVVDTAGENKLVEFVAGPCLSGSTVNTDEWCGHDRVGAVSTGST
jgi:ISXO2-like transposase domain